MNVLHHDIGLHLEFTFTSDAIFDGQSIHHRLGLAFLFTLQLHNET